MKKLIIYIALIAGLLIAAGISSKGRRTIDDNTIFYGGFDDTDSLHNISEDTLNLYIANQIGDSTAVLETRTITRSDRLSEALRDTILSKLDSTGVYYQAVIGDSTGALVDSLKIVLSDAKAYAEQVWIDSTTQAEVVIPNDLTVHGELAVDDTLRIDGFRLHGDGDYLEFFGKDNGARYQYYFYNGGISLGADMELYDGNLNMHGAAGDGNLNLGYNSGTGYSDTLRWGSSNTYVGKIFQKLIDGRPYLTIENTGIRLNSASGETWVADSLQVDGYIYGGDNAHIAKTLDADSVRTYSAQIDTLENVDYLQFDTSFTDGCEEARMQWNIDDGTPEIGMQGGKVNLQIGQEMIERVKNDTGTPILNGKLVYGVNTSGTPARRSVALADNTNPAKDLVIGMATEDIATLGYITTIGVVRGSATQPINTSAYASEDTLYATTNGDFTNVKPTAPNAVILIGTVKRVHATEGQISVLINHIPSMPNLTGNYGYPSADGHIYSWDTTDARFEIPTVKITDTVTMPEGGYFESIGADTTAVVDAVFKSLGKFASMDGYFMDNGFSIVPTSATETTLSGSDKVYVRADFIPNRYYSTSPTSTIIGDGAGKTGMSGDENVIVGNEAGEALTTGAYNSLYGFKTGEALTTGAYNSLYGRFAGYKMTTAEYNSFFGYVAGANTTGSNNTFYGSRAGQTNIGGSNNTFIGMASGRNNSTGSFNTAHGDSSAYNQTTGNRNIVIGSKAALVNATDSDKLIIGSAKWDGATLTQRRIISGDFSTGIVTIDSSLVVGGDFTHELRHAHLYYSDSTLTIDITQNVWLQLTNPTHDLFTVDECAYMTCAGDSITIITPGDYVLYFNADGTGGATNDIIRFGVAKNSDTPLDLGKPKDKTAANDAELTHGWTWYLNGLVAGDDLKLMLTDTTGNASYVAQDAVIYIRKERD